MKNQKITDACKNAIGTVFLLVSGLLMWSVFSDMKAYGDPIAPTAVAAPRVSPARMASSRNTTTARSTVARTGASRSTLGTKSSNARSIKTRSISVRSNDGSVQNVKKSTRSTATVAPRSIAARGNADNTTMRGVASRSTQRVVARTATTPSRVSLVGAGLRASTGTGVSVSYLTNKLYTGNYSNIIDSTTGMISADAYSTCLESYYTCMDEICTARSDTKGRCSCAGRATNFLNAETELEKANEELISLSGQLALLISTKGKDVSEAFKLTDAEKVMNCVSYKDMINQYGGTSATADANKVQEWCYAHGFYTSTCAMPDYCKDSGTNGNDFGFDIDKIDGSSSDILASLKAWANAKDLAKQFQENDDDLLTSYTAVAGVVNGLAGINATTETTTTDLDTLANKWGYELFQYAHNNVCGRVLDSCFNGIYEGCGTPPTVKVNNSTGGTTTATLCANNATSNCPFNYNSKVAISSEGEVELNERGSTNATTKSSAACFGYSTSTTTSGATSTTDPYASLRGPVADARRSIMQKYLLDANAACDAYGTALKNTAQNINYQKIAAEQALRQKRMQFYTEEQEKVKSDAVAAITNFNECISEIWDCYTENEDEENWSSARIKTYCAQVSNVPHCYEPMICDMSPLMANAIIDKDDLERCSFDSDYTKNTCRNVVTLNEILYRASNATNPYSDAELMQIARGQNANARSYDIREACLLKALGCDAGDTNDGSQGCLRSWKKPTSTGD